MRGFPISRRDYAATVEAVAIEADRAALHRLIDSGHELVAFMEPGGSVFVGGAWREIIARTAESDARSTLVCADDNGDCTEWLTRDIATRRYRAPAEAVAS